MTNISLVNRVFKETRINITIYTYPQYNTNPIDSLSAMTHSSRFNFKAKAESKGNLHDRILGNKDELITLKFAVEEQTKLLLDIQAESIKCATTGQRCVALLDETRNVGLSEFEVVEEHADKKLEMLAVIPTLRRLHQIMCLMGQRIETLAEDVTEYETVLGGLQSQAATTTGTLQHIQNVLTDTMVIGRNATEREKQEAAAAAHAGRDWHRYGIVVEDPLAHDLQQLDIQTLEANGYNDKITNHTRNVSGTTANESDDDDGSDDEEDA